MRRLAVAVAAAVLGACGADIPDAPPPTSSTSTTLATCQPVPDNTLRTLELGLRQAKQKLRNAQQFKSSEKIENAGGEPTFIAAQSDDGAILIFVKLATGGLLAVNDEARNRSTLPGSGNLTLQFPGAKDAASCSVNATTTSTAAS